MNVLQLEGHSDGKLLVLPAAIGSAIPAAVAGISFTMVYIEPPCSFTLGIHALVSTMLQRGVLVVVAGEPGDCRGIVDSLREQHQDTGFCAIKLSVYHLNKKSPQFTMGCTEVNLLSKHPLPQKVSDHTATLVVRTRAQKSQENGRFTSLQLGPAPFIEELLFPPL